MYDEQLAARIRALLPDLPTKNMFGGVCWMDRGNMIGGVARDELMLRVGVDAAAELLTQEFVRPMDFTGRPMKGWLAVEPEAMASDSDLQGWLDKALEFTGTLPDKS